MPKRRFFEYGRFTISAWNLADEVNILAEVGWRVVSVFPAPAAYAEIEPENVFVLVEREILNEREINRRNGLILDAMGK
jgi:hypothetical protein